VFTEIAPVVSPDTYVPYQSGGECFDFAKEQAEVVPAAEVGWQTERIQVYTTAGGVNADNAQLGIETAVDALEAGIPIVFGLDYDPYHFANNSDKTTDHFVTAVGITFPSSRPGQLCFSVYDNASGNRGEGTDVSENYFCVNPNGSMTGQTVWTDKRDATTVSQVRPNRKPLPSSTGP
jgi:hypothetical protein